MFLRTIQRFDGRPLADLRRTRIGVRHPADEVGREGLIGGETQAPTGHCPGFRRAVSNDGALLHTWQFSDGNEFTVVYQATVDVVGVDPNLWMLVEDGGDIFHILARQNATGGILRRIQNQEFGLARDLVGEFIWIESKLAFFAQEDRHRHCAVRADLRFVNGKAGIRKNHFVARAVVGAAQNRIGDERLRPGADDDIIGRNRQAAHAAQITRRRFA